MTRKYFFFFLLKENDIFGQISTFFSYGWTITYLLLIWLFWSMVIFLLRLRVFEVIHACVILIKNLIILNHSIGNTVNMIANFFGRR